MSKICKQLQEEMGAYVYEDPPQDAAQHLKTCIDCQTHYENLKETYNFISSTLKRPNPDLEMQVKYNIRKLLASNKISMAYPNKTLLNKIPWLSIACGVIFFIIGLWFGRQTVPAKATVNSTLNPLAPIESEKQYSEVRLTWLSEEALQFIKYGSKGIKEKND